MSSSLPAFPGILSHKLSASLSPALYQSSMHSSHAFTERAASLLLFPPLLLCRAFVHPLQCSRHAGWLAMSQLCQQCCSSVNSQRTINSSCMLSMLRVFVHVSSCLLPIIFCCCFWDLFCSCNLVPFTLDPCPLLLNCRLWCPFPSFVLQSFPHEVGQPVDKDFTLDSCVGYLSYSCGLSSVMKPN